MPTTFLMINTEIGSEAEVLTEVRKVEGVVEAYALYGVYDIFARVKADTMDKLKDVVNVYIRKIKHIRSTLSMIAVEEQQIV